MLKFLSGLTPRSVYSVIFIVSAALLATARLFDFTYVFGYIALIIMLLYAVRPTSRLHNGLFADSDTSHRLMTAAICVATIFVLVLPMDKIPLWNGSEKGHRDQYEMMADNILEGRISFDYNNDDEALSKLENPYDPEERKAAKVTYHWDHAYYDGEYYMYFGIVPVFLVYLPFKVLTGVSLTGYHGTQIFVSAAIAGIFALFALLTKRFFKKLPYSVYIGASVGVSVMSFWYTVAEPSLYCTAISSAVCLMVWSLYFYIKGVFCETKENKQLLYAGLGALFGSLTFGCRPPIALLSILVFPILVVFLRQRKFTVKLLMKLALCAIPYFVVIALLMTYNYVRFEDPFEFGQAYQLTVADQSNYSVDLSLASIWRCIEGIASSLFKPNGPGSVFPWLYRASVFFNFPILVLGALIFKPKVFRAVKENKLLPFIITLAVGVLLVIGLDVMWSPYLLERYHLDVYFIMGIGCFTVVGFWYETVKDKYKRAVSSLFSAMIVVTLVMSVLLYVRTVGLYYPESMPELAEKLHI